MAVTNRNRVHVKSSRVGSCDFTACLRARLLVVLGTMNKDVRGPASTRESLSKLLSGGFRTICSRSLV